MISAENKGLDPKQEVEELKGSCVIAYKKRVAPIGGWPHETEQKVWICIHTDIL